MKLSLVLCLAIASVVVALPAESPSTVTRYATNGITVSIAPAPLPETTGSKFCGTCASLTGQSLNILLNYILQAGVVGGCSKVCGNLKTKTEQTVCSIACDLAGVKAFAAAIEKADLDPIYFCEQLNFCPHDDNGAGSIASLDVSPLSAEQGSKFEGDLSVTVTNHTGAGEFRFGISGGVDPDSGASSIFPELNPGSYTVKISIDTTPAEDPTKGAQWVPGNYTLAGEFCMGECGSKHPHSKVFGETVVSFTIN